MRDYRSVLLIVMVLLAGAATPASGEKELIIRLQGEVMVLQRQLRDLQESVDKWQGQSSSSLQKISENSTATVRGLEGLGDTLKAAQTSQVSGLAGASSQLQRILDQLGRQSQGQAEMGRQMGALRQQLADFQQKMETREKEPQGAVPEAPEAIYLAAYSSFNRGSYDNAIRLAGQYLSLSATGREKRADMKFVAAESFYLTGRNADALREFEQLLAQYPESDKAPQAILGKGLCLLHLERRDEGIQALRAAIAQHPGSSAAERARKELSRLGENY